MAADNVKTAFCLPSGANEDFAEIQYRSTNNNNRNKNIKQQQQNINQSKSEGVSKSTQGKTWAEASF